MKPATHPGRTGSLRASLFLVALALAFAPNDDAAARADEGEEGPEFTSIAEVRLLSRREAAKAHRVRVRGVVTYCNTFLGSLYLQDGDQGVLVRFFRTDTAYRPGKRIEVEGVTQEHFSAVGVCIGDAKLRDLGEAELPPINELKVSRAKDEENLLRHSRLTGVIQYAEKAKNGHWVLWLRDGGEAIHCYIRDGVPEDFDPLSVLDAEVSVLGVIQPASNTDPKQRNVVLVVHDFKDLAVMEPPPPAPFSYPVTAIANLSKGEPHAVHVRARVVGETKKDRLTVRDDSGTIDVRIRGNCWVQENETVDLIGFAATTSDGLQFFAAQIGLFQPNARTDPKRGSSALLPTIFDIATVRQLDANEAEKGYPVRVRGVVTHRHPSHHTMFIQDGANGIFVADCPEVLPLNKLVEVHGFASPGDVLPIVRATRFLVVGDAAGPLPQRISMYDIQTGNLDCNLVQIEGVVQEVKSWAQHAGLVLMTPLGYVEVCVAEGTPEQAADLIDARVRVVGAYSVIPDHFGRMTGYRIFTTFLGGVEVLDPPPPDPFEQEAQPIDRLLTYQRERVGPHRVKIRGTVTGVSWGGSVCVQDERGSIRVRPTKSKNLRPGDSVEVVGFLALGQVAPRLNGAIVRERPDRTELRVESISVQDALDGKIDGHLVRLQARLLNRFARLDEEVLLVQSENTIFEVILGCPDARGRFDHLAHGTLLEVTGICVLRGDRVGGIRSFQIEASEPDEIRVIETPRAWVTPMARWMIGLGLALLLLTVVWVVALRGQVRRQTALIRERLENESKLEARYRDLCEHARDMIFSTDAMGRITSFNAAGERITGYSRGEVVGKQLQELILPHEDEKLNNSIHADASPFEMRFRRREGDTAVFEVTSRPMIEFDGQLLGFEAIARDVTQRKRTEEDLRQSAKMQAIGQLAGGIAHDFNNLLTVINGYTELILSSLDPEWPYYDSLREIGKAGDRAASLTQQLLAFSRRSIITPRLLSINESVREMEKLLHRLLGETVRLTTELDEELPLCRLDSGMVGQVLMNLSVNAKDAMPQGGELTIRTWTLDDEYVRLEVRDTGCGMDRETRKHIFEPYFTTKPLGQGTGLGLATVFGIVESSGGRIAVESEPGKGTTFRIDFPIAGLEEEEDELSAAPDPESAIDGVGTILLVEDDPNVRALEQRVLEASGYRVLVAGTGAEAMEIVSRSMEKPDLLVTDVVMPRMNGRELGEHVRRMLPSISILFLSGYTNDEILRMGVLTEEANFLHKPFKPQELTRKIREILQHSMVESWHGS